MFQDGFTTRLRNRRIICWKKGDSWHIKFVKFTKEDDIHAHLDQYDFYTKKMSGYRLVTVIKLSEEAFINLTHMGFAYLNPHISFAYKQPMQIKDSISKPKKN